VFRSSGVQQVALAGGVTRKLFVSGFRMDLTAIRMLSRLRRFSDDSLLRAIMGEIESSGVTVFAPHLLLADNVPVAGVFSPRPLTPDERGDVEVGWSAAHTLGALDIGQSVVIRNRTVIAVEAVEGTDATLMRAGEVSGKGGVLIKVCKPSQDTRVDLPTIGVRTLEQCARSRITAIVGDAGKTIVLDPQAVRETAGRLGIAIEFWESST
jgi:UDP-2,3-diacylglucosamine hydrolase